LEEASTTVEFTAVLLQIAVALLADMSVELDKPVELLLLAQSTLVELAREVELEALSCLWPFALSAFAFFAPLDCASQAVAFCADAHNAVLLLASEQFLKSRILVTERGEEEDETWSHICDASCVSAALICWSPEATLCWLALH
jgi:hypothetical protein